MHTSKKGFIVILICCIIIVISYSYYKNQHTAVPSVPSVTNPTPSMKKEDSTSTILSVGETKEILGAIVTLESIIQDSRCPLDVQCIQKGTVDVKITLRFPLETKATELSLDKPIRFGDYTITITDVTPTKNSKKETKPSDYKVTLLVVKLLDEEKK